MSSPATGTAIQSSQAAAGAGAAPWRRVVQGKLAWRIHPDLDEEETATIIRGVEKPEEYFRRSQAGSPSAVFRFSGYVAKRYRAPTLQDRLKTLVRGTRAQRALDWATKLAALGVPTIRPVAIASARGQPWESCIISSYIADRCTVHEFVESMDASRTRRWMIDALADIMARLHNAGISHGDAHLANFIVERREQPQLVLIDLDALRARKVSASVAANDLKRLLDYAPGSRAEHLRFLVRYGRRRQGRIDTRELLRHCRHGRRGPGPLRDAA